MASLAVVLFFISFILKLHEWDIYPFREMTRLLRRPWFEAALLMLFIGGMVQYGSTKGFLGAPPSMMCSPMAAVQLPTVSDSVSETDGIQFPAYTNAVTNVCFTGIWPASTSVFLRAAWPTDTTLPDNALEIYARPDLTTNGWEGIGIAAVAENTNDVVVELPRTLLPDGWASSMFFMLGLCTDTDGDGLSDSFENLVAKTDPDLADTDGDGLPDGWEYGMGLNPLSGDGNDGAAADTDGDGFSNIEEYRYGTHPTIADTDGDGLDDRQEIGQVEELRGSEFLWFDTTGHTSAFGTSSSYDSFNKKIVLPFDVEVNGVCYTNAQIDLDGLVTLIRPDRQSESIGSGFSSSGGMSNRLWSANHVTIAAYNTDIYARPRTTDWGSAFTYGSATRNGASYSVIEYRNVSHYNLGSSTSARMTFQVILPANETNVVYVSYLNVDDAIPALDRPQNFGIQLPATNCVPGRGTYANVSWGKYSGCFAQPLTLKYTLGTGTNPNAADADGDGLSDPAEIFVHHTDPYRADTDGDGLNDGREVELGTDANCADTDGDGMLDGWEVQYGTDPLVDDAGADPDWDGLPNIWEQYNGTDPHNEDADGDMLADGLECGWIEDGVTNIPWFTVQPILTYAPTDDTDRALIGCAMPITNRLAGCQIDTALADVNGVVYFGRPDTTNSLSSTDSGSNLSTKQYKLASTVAAYWTDLKMRSTLGSSIIFGTAAKDATNRFFVIEYRDVGTYSGNGNRISFQMSIPENEPNLVYVRYGTITDARTNYRVSIGAQGAKVGNYANTPLLNHYYQSNPPTIQAGRTVAFHFGAGSDPLVADTDGDGLDDRVEHFIGTNPRDTDTDCDGFDDRAEVEYGMNPVSSVGVDGADGDFDGDGLPNAQEVKFGTLLNVADCDGDGLPDGEETGYIAVSNDLPWLTFDQCEDCTTDLVYQTHSQYHVNRGLPCALTIQGELVTNITFTSTGWLFFNKAGLVDKWRGNGSSDFTYKIDADTLAIAAYGDSMFVATNAAERSTVVRYGTATHDGVGYVVIEYDNLYCQLSSSTTNSISFQIALPTNTADRVCVRYRNVTGTSMNGRYCGIGMQTFGGKWLHSYCYCTAGKVYEGLGLQFSFGRNADPLKCDSDNDGLADALEATMGTNLNSCDTDGDGLPDAWEVQYGLDPLVAAGDDGANGDFDGDGMSNYDEYLAGTNPSAVDTDNDGLTDLQEMGGITTNNQPWLSFTTETNLTAALDSDYGAVVTWQIPEPIYLHGECVTTITIDSCGLVYFNRKGTVRTWSVGSERDLSESWTIQSDAFTVAPYWSDLCLTDVSPVSMIRVGTAILGTNSFFLVQYDGVCPDGENDRQAETNSLSWQLAVPFGDADRMYVRYSNQIGDTDGQDASIGYQDFDGVSKCSYCYREGGKVSDGLSLAFAIGVGTSPILADSDGNGTNDVAVYLAQIDSATHDADGDGLIDTIERQLGTNLLNADSDGDGMSDGWEHQYGFNPLQNSDADGDADNDGVSNLVESLHGSNPHSNDTDGDGLSDSVELSGGTSLTKADTDDDGLNDKYEIDNGLDPKSPDTDRDGMTDGWEVANGLEPNDDEGDDGASGDPDNDGLTNVDEYQNNCDPQDPDTDGDGVSDGVEVGQGSDPTDASDRGIEPPEEKFRELVFNIYGDYAAWEMTIAGQGPDDTRTQIITMGAPGARRDVSKKLRKGNSYRITMRWLNCDGHNDNMSPWYCWQALIDGMPAQNSFNDNYIEGRCERISQRNNIVVGNGWIAENDDGLLTSHVHASQKNSHGGPGAGNVAQGLVATLYVLDDPKLTPDYNGDGRIDQLDETILKSGRTFRFWVNDDKDDASSDGDVARNSKILDNGNDDIPASGSDGSDNKVNGRRDLVDFTPICVDVSGVVGDLPVTIRNEISFRIRQDDGAVNVVWSNLSPSGANSFQTVGYNSGFGEAFRSSPQSAETMQIVAGGVSFPSVFKNRARTGEGIFLVEGRQAACTPLWIEAVYGGKVLCSNKLEMAISSVENMYRWLGLRHICGDTDVPGLSSAEPANLPDNETTGPHYVFVHGYNVNAQSARGWAAEMFKRLWQTGVHSKFTAVDWYGDESQIWAGVPAVGGESLDYYVNVRHALDTAPHLQSELSGLPGERVVLAHSLGNMLVSEAATHYGLAYSKYYMLNAAVPMETYDSGVENSEMREHGWTDVPPIKWAANWYARISYENDPRRTLKWKGRFAGIGNAINCYSPTEEVLGNATANGYGGVWSIQELYKGTATLHFIPGNCEGGWGYNSDHTNLAGLLTEFAKTNDFTDVELIASPIFRTFDNDLLHQTNLISIAQTELNKVLGDGIPATSFAAGANEVGGVSGNLNYISFMANEESWPRFSRENGVKRLLWHHSDIKNIAYYFVYPLFEQLISEGD